MKVYMSINKEISKLLMNHKLPTNHKSQLWSVLSEDTSHVGFMVSFDDIFNLSTSQLEEHVPVGTYLLELDIDKDDIVEVMAYSDYDKLSKSSTIHTLGQITEILHKTKRVVNFAPVLAIIFKNLTIEKVSNVYRYGEIDSPWVECEIRNAKLYHKIG